MKIMLFFLSVFLLIGFILANAQPFGPPLYIADPVSMECRYYFAGDEKHFNPRPENYTVNIAYVTDMKSEQQACDFFKCVSTNGTVKVDEDKKPLEFDLCICAPGTKWDLKLGCVEIKEEKASFFQRIFGWIKKVLGIG